jgi:hypothetical protein
MMKNEIEEKKLDTFKFERKTQRTYILHQYSHIQGSKAVGHGNVRLAFKKQIKMQPK